MTGKTVLEVQARLAARQTVDLIKETVGASTILEVPKIVIGKGLGVGLQKIDAVNNVVILDEDFLGQAPSLVPVIASRATAKCVYNSNLIALGLDYFPTSKDRHFPIRNSIDAIIYVSTKESFSNFLAGYYLSPEKEGKGRKDRIVRTVFAEFPSLSGIDHVLDIVGAYIKRDGPGKGIAIGKDMALTKRTLGSAIATIVYEQNRFDPVSTAKQLFIPPHEVLGLIRGGEPETESQFDRMLK